ncbi:MAG: Stk1 family PASTA domain-containing Ser/Thr kinase [Mycobacteriales bacterium]
MDGQAQGTTDALVGVLLDGRYRLDRPVARGGMATVYTATDTRLDRIVAVKVMRSHLAEDPEFVERFSREARAAARLSTPEVVAVHDQGTDAATGTAYLVMEYVAGRTLRDLIRDGGPLPPGRALELLEPVLRALAAAHGAGLIHRDVKPENVLLGDDGRVKVADFGLARAIETSNITATGGLLMGTVAYLAPEQVEHGTADPRTDVYAAGILLWEMLTGAPPYGGATPLSVAYRHVNDDVPPPSTVVEGIPQSVDDLVVSATRRDPAARPVDAGAFLAELRAVRGDLPPDPIGSSGQHETVIIRRTPPVAPAPTGAEAQARRRRRPGLLAGTVIALLAILALAGGWYLGSGRYTAAPGVLGLTQQAAQAKLDAAGLDARISPDPDFSESVDAGLVLRQDPKPNGRVRKSGSVTLVLSRGPDRRLVPDLIGSTEKAATEQLDKVGLRVGPVTKEFSSAAVGTVIRTGPVKGKGLRPGSAVALVLSKGVQQIDVPDVRGKKQAEAEQILTDAGFVATSVEVFDDNVDKGVVVDQSPNSGTAGKGSTVTLQVSKGPPLVTVPDVRGMSRQDAEKELHSLGLKTTTIRFPGANTVRNQTPRPGSKVPKGSTVTLGVY